MSAYIRELCLDYAVNRVDMLEKFDIEIGINNLIMHGLIGAEHLAVVRAYLSGYDLSEIVPMYPNAEELLITFFGALAYEIDYNDEYIITMGVRLYPKHAATIDAYRRKIEVYGRTF